MTGSNMSDTKQVKAARPKPPAAGRGRVKGALNKTTGKLKEAILLAAEGVGSDGKGKDGLTGYLTHVAKTDVKAFSGLLGKVLPMQVVGDENGGGIQIVLKQFKIEGDN